MLVHSAVRAQGSIRPANPFRRSMSMLISMRSAFTPFYHRFRENRQASWYLPLEDSNTIHVTAKDALDKMPLSQCTIMASCIQANTFMCPNQRIMLIDFGFTGPCDDTSKLRLEKALFLCVVHSLTTKHRVISTILCKCYWTMCQYNNFKIQSIRGLFS